MGTVIATLFHWARRSPTSLMPPSAAAAHVDLAIGATLYRLRHWPDLPSTVKTAGALRLMSVMSSRAVSRQWMLQHSTLSAQQIDDLLQRLMDQDALTVTPSPKA